MEILHKAPRPIDAPVVMAVLRERLSEILDRPIWVTSAEPSGDLLARDVDGGHYVIRRLAPNGWDAQCHRLLHEIYERSQDQASSSIGAGIRSSSRPTPVTWLFVADEVPQRWLEAASALAVRVEFLQAHYLTTQDKETDALYFELLRPPGLAEEARDVKANGNGNDPDAMTGEELEAFGRLERALAGSGRPTGES